MHVVLDVDTGTDDTGALWVAAIHPAFDHVAVTATWRNTSQAQAARNTLAVLHAVERLGVAVYAGAGRWLVAVSVDADRFHAGVRAWLSSGGSAWKPVASASSGA